jgi:pullulanase-type alpha-1,6-glucosidase
VLDDLYTYGGDLGVVFSGNAPSVHLWAPTARAVEFHLFDDADPATGSTSFPMTLDPATGVWSIEGTSDWKNQFYLFEVEVYVHSTGAIENNRVTDPYSLNLSMNSARSQLVDLADNALKPASWDSYGKPPLPAPEDISIYELHVRDFSISDESVPDALKGTYKAFTLADSNGRLHLEQAASAGLTHIHLLPVFDIATVNENKSEWMQPDPAELAGFPPDSSMQQAAVTTYEDVDGFNWGYDPWHYTTPDGSYATDPNGRARIVEFRSMVKALNEAGLRVVMDVVYNHTTASGQNDKSVLDRIVPGYYHRLNETGAVETSTCCDNTASEHAMMEKLMVDSIVTWATAYKVDAFRFDLMGHHSKQNMLNVRAALDALTIATDGVEGQSIYIYGEGWNFGEVANNARFIQATQANMAGTGIGTFSDRLRDAVRGGGPVSGLQEQGFATGLSFDSNGISQGYEAEELLFLQDLIRNTMAGQLKDYAFEDRNGNVVTGEQLDYFGQPAGYTEDPQEVIVYSSAHDGETMFDAVQLKVPGTTSVADRVRSQNIAVSTVALSQGVPFFHAGMDMLRSKSMDRDSFNSGDWFNKLDFTYETNNWGGGLPVASKNESNWGIMRPLLGDPGIVPVRDDIVAAVHHFREMLEIRKSSPLFRLRTAEEIIDRLSFHNTGPGQTEGLIVMSLSDTTGSLDAKTEGIMVLINAGVDPVSFARDDIADLPWTLHPVLAASSDPIAQTSDYDKATGAFNVPARTTAVFVGKRSAEDQIDLILDLIDELEEDGVLTAREATWLRHKPEQALTQLAKGHNGPASNQMENFIVRVEELVRRGVLTEAEGQALIDAAHNVIDCIEE